MLGLAASSKSTLSSDHCPPPWLWLTACPLLFFCESIRRSSQKVLFPDLIDTYLETENQTKCKKVGFETYDPVF